jgi:hypothetical protein
VLEGALLPQDLEDPLLAEALAAAAGGRAITLHLIGAVSRDPSEPEQLPAAHTADDQPGISDTRSPEERWAADRAYLASNGVPEERLSRLEYDMLGAGHCQVCQMLALEDSAAADVVPEAVANA